MGINSGFKGLTMTSIRRDSSLGQWSGYWLHNRGITTLHTTGPSIFLWGFWKTCNWSFHDPLGPFYPRRWRHFDPSKCREPTAKDAVSHPKDWNPEVFLSSTDIPGPTVGPISYPSQTIMWAADRSAPWSTHGAPNMSYEHPIWYKN
jgi:hypothetical protein